MSAVGLHVIGERNMHIILMFVLALLTSPSHSVKSQNTGVT